MKKNKSILSGLFALLLIFIGAYTVGFLISKISDSERHGPLYEAFEKADATVKGWFE